MAQQPDTVVTDTSEMPAMDSAYAFGRGYEKRGLETFEDI